MTAPTAASMVLHAVSEVPAQIAPDGARRLITDLLPVDHQLATARYQSPLRYPGAKSTLAPIIARLVNSAKRSARIREINLLVEPFAGGGSVSLRLVGAGVVDRVLLADADPLVAAFWQEAAANTANLIDRMWDEWRTYVQPGGSIAVARWDYWRAWTPPAGTSAAAARREAAVKALFLNRTTFSGILHGRAGPVGGRTQVSDYSIGARWTPQAIEDRLALVGHLYDTGRLLDVWCKDWRSTLDDVAEQYAQLLPSRVLAYLDPPYLDKSSKLYQRSFDPRGGYRTTAVDDLLWGDARMHFRLAEYLTTRAQYRWLLSYDAHPSLTTSPWLYADDRMTPSRQDRELLGISCWRIIKRYVTLQYSASARVGRGPRNELLLTTLPPSTVPCNAELRAAR